MLLTCFGMRVKGSRGNLQNYTINILKWNKEVFGNIFTNKKTLKARLKGIQIAQERQYSHNLDILEQTLKKDLELVLKQEELFWLQKSRVQWITEVTAIKKNVMSQPLYS